MKEISSSSGFAIMLLEYRENGKDGLGAGSKPENGRIVHGRHCL